MELEKVALEVAASKAGLNVLKGAVLQGRSGIDHKFAFVASDGVRSFAFDFYNGARDVDVLRTFVKKYDTGIEANIISAGSRPTQAAASLAGEYGMKILGTDSLASFFRPQLVQPRPTRSATRA